ncbi:type II secretion system major pseudopilin GspG [Aminivibrio sp.]|uniref:type II secretion system major pseudopilin GspG n=1 Tax=Aminivibrio sp. TaxID=1872489 RepID=UPI00345E16D3
MKKRQQKRKGFTLVEVLVVVVILGLLAALVVPRVVGRGEEAKRTAAAVQIREIEQALEMYRLDSSLYPSTAQGIEALVSKPSIPPEPRKYREGGYLRKLPADPWGSPFVYRRPGDDGEYDLFSLGADGEEGGDGPGKDITNWE